MENRYWYLSRLFMLGFGLCSLAFGQAVSLNTSLSLNPDPVVPGQSLTTQILIANGSTSPTATGVSVRLILPNGLSFSSERAFPGPDSSGFYLSGNLCTWTLGTLTPGESRLITVLFSVSSSLASGASLQLRPVVVANGMSDLQLSETAVVATALPVRVLVDLDKDPVRAGDVVSYTATFANVSNLNAPNTTLSMSIPSGTTFVSASHDGVFAAGSVRWPLGILSAGESGERVVTVAVNSGSAPGNILFGRATLTDTNVPPNSSRATAACAVVAATPISVKLAVNPNPTFADSLIRGVVTVANQSGSDYGNLVVRLLLPTSMSFSSERAYPTTTQGWFFGEDSAAVWSLGTLPAGQGRTIVVPFSASSSLSDGAIRQFRVRVDASSGTRVGASQVVVIDSTPVLALAVEEDRDPIAAGELISYKVVIGNPTSIAAPNVTMKASLPLGTVFESANGAGSHSGGVITWNLGTVGPGRSGERNFTVRVNSDVPNGSIISVKVTAEDTLEPQNTARAATNTAVRAGSPLTLGFSFTNSLYTLVISNRGSADLGGVAAYALTPDILSYSSSNASPPPDQFGFYSEGSLAKWTLGSVFIGQARSITIPLNTNSSRRAVNGRLITYHAFVTQPANDWAIFRELTLRFADPTSITLQPRSVSAAVGGTATFSATVGGSSLPLYQWRFNGQDIPGATSATLTLTNVQPAQAGNYTLVVIDSGQTLVSDPAALTVNTNDARLVNVAIRSNAGTGASTLIVGFNLAGTGSKQLLIRGVGPTLGVFGLSGVLADPTLRLDVLNGALVAQNNDWGGTATISNAASSVGAFALPAASRDAVLLQTLSPGGYTAQIGGGTGVALVEVYDTGTGSNPKLSAASARTQVGTGSDILILGFTVSGSGSRKILIRGVGPTLGAFGVTGVLADPRLQLYRLNGPLLFDNDNWGSSINVPEIRAATTSAGSFALSDGSLDAVLLVDLAPGSYTAQVSGIGGRTGVALVEIYEVP
jgi:uncharacterized repeat protein (TIGR01451 family)